MLVNDKPKDNSFASEERERRKVDNEAYYQLKNVIEKKLGDLNIPIADDPDGDTLLIAASYQGYTNSVRLLLSVKGIDIHATNNNGETALDVADNEDIKNMLRDAEKGVFPTILRKGPQRS